MIQSIFILTLTVPLVEEMSCWKATHFFTEKVRRMTSKKILKKVLTCILPCGIMYTEKEKRRDNNEKELHLCHIQRKR